MKNIFGRFIIAIMLSLSLAACGASQSASPGGESGQADASQSTSGAGEGEEADASAETDGEKDSDGDADTGGETAAETDTSAAGDPDPSGEKDTAAKSAEDTEQAIYPAPDFTLTDQYGNTHTLSDYKGKVVFLNFWATWCPPCREEMPDIQALYEEYSASEDSEVVILGIAAPGSVDDRDEEGVRAFLSENGYTYPVVMDLTGEQFQQYYIMAYPTTFMIDKDGNIFGYVQGMMTKDVMRDIINQTLAGKRSDG